MKRIAALLVAICMLVCSLPAFAADSPSTASAVSVPPGRIDAAVAQVDGLARAMMKKSGIPGMSVAIVHDGKIVFLKGYGVRNTRTKKPVDPDTVFMLASVSKSVGASVIAAEVARGTVKWTDPVAKYLPGFTLSDPWVGSHVTIGDMYAHRSGLPDHAGDILEDLGYSRAEGIARLRYYHLDPFRITYHYTNFGLTAGAEAVAHAAHTSWEQLSRERIYAPLGMTHTSSRAADYMSAKDRADLHVRQGTGFAPLYVRDADAQSPAGGVSSTARDMAKWMEFELGQGVYNGKQLVDAKDVTEPWAPRSVIGVPPAPGRASFYGYGMNVGYDSAGRLRLSHSGAFALGAATAYTMLPSEHLGIVVLTNAIPVGAAEALAAEFIDRAEFGKQLFDWYPMYAGAMAGMLEEHGELVGRKPPVHPTPFDANQFVGTYQNNLYGPAMIEATNGKLSIVLGPKKMRFPLTHWTGDLFSFVPPGESSTGITAVHFTATAMTIEYLNEEGVGTFTR